MNPSVRSVTAWNPGALRATAVGLDNLVDELDNRMRGLLNDQDVLAEQWKGDAANAAALRVVRERSLGSAIAGALLQVADAYRTGAPIVEGARMHAVGLVRAAEHQSFTVHNNGIVDASNQISLLRALLPPGATYDTASLQLERQAAELSVALVDALQQAAAAADDATARLNAAVAVLEDAAEAATPGEVVKSESGGEFSWVPDVPATVAASTIGVMTDVTDKALTSAAISAGDDLAVGVSKGLGPFAAVLGTIPAINNDIEGGMDPAKAVITEGAGAAAGLGGTYLGTKMGGAIGTMIAPGAGTAVGILVGAVLGGGATWFTSKILQKNWV